MKKHLTTLMALAALTSLPISAMAQDAVNTDNTGVIAAESQSASASAAEAAQTTSAASSEKISLDSDDATGDSTKADSEVIADPSKSTSKAKKKSSDGKDDDDEDDDDKSWSVGADLAISLGLGAFQKDEHAKRIRSMLLLAINGSYTIPVIDVDVHAETGFSQWLSKAGGSNGKYEFRWADSAIGFSRNIWDYKKGAFFVSFDADLSFALPTSTASINTDLYTTISPTLGATIKLANFSFEYAITYSHSFNKYTSTTLDPSEVDVLARTAGNEFISADEVAIGGILTEIELLNQFVVGYKFLKNFGMKVGLGVYDAWSYDNGIISSKDEFTSPNAKVGRGHTQASIGNIALYYVPIKYLTLALSMKSKQPWKTADNKTYRFPWFDTVSPSKNFTSFIFSASFVY